MHGVRLARIVALLLVDTVLVSAGWWAALALRFGGDIPAKYIQWGVAVWPWLVGVRLVVLNRLGLHAWSFRLSGLAEAVSLIKAQLLGSLLAIALVWGVLGHDFLLSRGVFIIEALLTTVALLGVRFLPRAFLADRDRWRESGRTEGSVRTLILGAGPAADALIREAHHPVGRRLGETLPTRIVGLLDDRKDMQGISVQGVRVLGSYADLQRIARQRHAEQIILADDSLTGPTLRGLLQQVADLKLRFLKSRGGFTNGSNGGRDTTTFSWVSGGKPGALTVSHLERLEAVQPEDLLARPQIAFEPGEIDGVCRGNTILITGAAGSIGSELTRQAALHGASRLALVDLNESELYLLKLRLEAAQPGSRIELFVRDLREKASTERLVAEVKPDVILHAAAHKHVPLLEACPEEAIKNNVLATQHLASAAVAQGVERFLFISTDKAVHPTSVMGASKRVAEEVVRHIASRAGLPAGRFVAVRFGNVLGSSGSVVPIFKEQIRRGGPVTLTHKEMTRYFMTTAEAVSLCLVALARGVGSLAVLEMGECVRIEDLARSLITLSGLQPDVDIEIVYTGIRPGEKLAEKVLTEAEEARQQVFPGLITVTHPPIAGSFEAALNSLADAATAGDRAACLAGLRQLVPSYSPVELAKA